MSSNIQGMFGRIAGTYDQVNHTLSSNQDIAWRKASAEQLTRDGYVPKKVLDLCAGTGDFALAVKEKSPHAEVVLADFAKPMLVLAKGKAGGQTGLGFVDKPTGMFARTAYFFYMGSIMPARGAAISKDKAAYEYLNQSAKNFVKVKDFQKLMEDNGFKDVVIEARMLGVAYSVMGVRK
jgi:demethylmenaquinone methyltransferase/2-methoxy-6-polyprenyl-1,4-benzoquinol methylase